MSIDLDTIGSLLEHEHNLRAYCNACHHCTKLDLNALGKRLGFNHSTMHDDLTPKLKCSTCGSKDIALILSADSTEERTHTR